ncbi:MULTISPECIES: CAF17-like 4Fe-4S cluster assembly/insertion protein YgfZ [unclassified Plantibacter]|uniref:CAF17-like 4Fe-4S cluster assembly/insertion protein YgfZ n=1 Tax=unclassified Plantibacter TaxID=2624265 RepID=UPI000A7DAE7B|nr:MULTISPECIES: folate-binding protein [unclassified Plantibacter]
MSTSIGSAVPSAVPGSPFLTLPGAVEQADAFDHGVPSHYGSPNIEQRLISRGTAIVDLSNRGVVTITGPDRLSWLHSITSQDLRSLPAGTSTETLFLDQSGRIEHAAKLLDDGTTTWIITEADDAAPLHAWLDRMRFMLRVEVAIATEQYAVIGAAAGLAIDAAAPNGLPLVWHDPWSEVAVGGHQYATGEHPGATWTWTETIVERATLDALAQQVRAGAFSAAGSLAAEALRIAAWRPRLQAEVDERSIPHELDWLRSAVHLNKGCYRGQETVAKVHNLGHPPRRLVMLLLDGSDAVLPSAGSDVVLVTGGDEPVRKTVGSITSSAIHHELGPVALAVVKRSTDPAAVLTVEAEGVDVAASQEIVVPADAGATANVPRLPRLGAVRR